MGTKQTKSGNGFAQGEYCDVEKSLESVLRANAVIVNEA